VLLKSVPLWWRRSEPVAALTIIGGALAIGGLLGLTQTASDGGVIFAVYAVSVYARTNARLLVAGLAVLLTIAGVISALAGLTPHQESLPTLGPPALVAWVIGDYIRGRRLFLTELIARHRRESDASRSQAVEQERLRIARELHDVVAHNVSVMAIQAGAARIAKSGAQADRKALESIETTARDTLAELNRLLGVLRKESNTPTLSPQPGLAEVEALLKPVREAGVQVNLNVAGEVRPLPAAVDMNAYRIVQEAVTNVFKHAHASRIDVRVAYLPDALELTIRDNGDGGSAEAVQGSAGHGLIGMRERVAMFGGDLEVGVSDVGGFTVHARLPLR
jgi:signal transduction histidine kinase